MGASSYELPTSFEAAMRLSQRLLSASHELIKKDLIETESEQIVIEAYRFATGKSLSRAELFFRAKDRFPDTAGDRVIVHSMARAAGKPLQHLLGFQVFLNHEYEVGADVLIPRPETEVLVTEAIRELSRQSTPPSNGIEIGIGSGIISIELLHCFPALRMTASELSPEARSRAQRNALKILGSGAKGADRLSILPASSPQEVWQPFQGTVQPGFADLVISNPPYLVRSSQEADPEVAAHEPAAALFAPEGDPLFFYREIAAKAAYYLKSDGLIFLEIPHERSQDIQALFKNTSWSATTVHDLNSRDRVLIARAF